MCIRDSSMAMALEVVELDDKIIGNEQDLEVLMQISGTSTPAERKHALAQIHAIIAGKDAHHTPAASEKGTAQGKAADEADTPPSTSPSQDEGTATDKGAAVAKEAPQDKEGNGGKGDAPPALSLIHISEPTRPY
eukprot:TRINITY_DN1621_c0_g1_i1.p1 TRINITY_DN1621_c0_g1~~TRINITY_DN1621_c0_g1_i1.p1  ORF type:complete len:151 (+),score=58.98 TRINITY_DN1621_c0_g1_i1:49-453(+)